MTRGERAKLNFLNGQTCAQSVLSAFSDVTGLNEETAMKLSLPFGGGFGRMRLVCGAFSAVGMIVGLVFGESSPRRENKDEVYAIVQELASRFKERTGSIMCGQILTKAGIQTSTSSHAEERTEEYYKKRPCPEIVAIAADVLENYLIERKIL